MPGTLLITEATFITAKAGGYANVPGIYSQKQIAAWKEIVEKVHQAGSIIYLQLWALGRTANPEVKKKEGTGDVVSASNVPENSDKPEPRPMSEEEIQEYIKDYATAAKNAVEGAGFDGVGKHASKVGSQIFHLTVHFQRYTEQTATSSTSSRNRLAINGQTNGAAALRIVRGLASQSPRRLWTLLARIRPAFD